MNDRELLELAAKAVGLKVISYSEGYGLGIDGDGVWWNPLGNDGQALRLAIELGLTISPANGMDADITEVYRSSSLLGRSSEGRAEKHDGDAISATRLAIVRAAAELGRQMV